MTLELGRIKTWRLPAFSALFMALSASLRTEVRTILAVDDQIEILKSDWEEMRYLDSQKTQLPPMVARVSLQSATSSLERKECPFSQLRGFFSPCRDGRSVSFWTLLTRKFRSKTANAK